MKSIGVVGGGIVGLATTSAILEDLPDVSVTVYSSEYSPNTTADVSAGWILPFLYGEEENTEDVVRWTSCTVDHLLKVANEDKDAATAISPLSGYLLWNKEPLCIPAFIRRCFMGCRLVSQSEIGSITENQYAGGVFFTTWTCKCSIYLPFIMKKLESKGVRFIKERVSSLDAIADKGHDVVVNCAGFGAKKLVNDVSLHPVRGQVLEVKAPWMKHFVAEVDGDAYALPRIDSVIVGGTHTTDTSLVVDKTVSRAIWLNACRFIPRLSNATIISEDVGIRPGRHKVRIEIEIVRGNTEKKYVVLHHYGHGGSGVTFHWGCAKQASKLLKELYGRYSNL